MFVTLLFKIEKPQAVIDKSNDKVFTFNASGRNNNGDIGKKTITSNVYTIWTILIGINLSLVMMV